MFFNLDVHDDVLLAFLRSNRGALSLLAQLTISQQILVRYGLAISTALLPMSVVLGSVGASLLQSLSSAAFARGIETIARGSVYRAGYELLYTPLRLQKRPPRCSSMLASTASEQRLEADWSSPFPVLLWLDVAGDLYHDSGARDHRHLRQTFSYVLLLAAALTG